MYLIVYDISENNVRTKIADKLIEWGFERIQYSVFVGEDNPAEIKELWESLKSLLTMEQASNDRLFAIAIDKQHFLNMKVLGTNDLDFDYLSGDLTTLIL